MSSPGHYPVRIDTRGTGGTDERLFYAYNRHLTPECSRAAVVPSAATEDEIQTWLAGLDRSCPTCLGTYLHATTKPVLRDARDG